MLSSRWTACAIRRNCCAEAFARSSSGASHFSFNLEIVIHCLTLMPSGETRLHSPLPLHASIHDLELAGYSAPLVRAFSPLTTDTGESSLLKPAIRLVGHASTQRPHAVHLFIASLATRSR